MWVARVQGPAVHGRTQFDGDCSDSCLLLSGIVPCPCALDGGRICYWDALARVILPPVDTQTSSGIVNLCFKMQDVQDEHLRYKKYITFRK